MSDQYAKCWAKVLGDCAGGMTGEHTISKSQFEGTMISVRGFSWCRDEPRKVGIGSLVANVLCQRHNNDLSPSDEAAEAMMRALKTIADRGDALRAGAPKPSPLIFRISGDNLERWLLKTTINLALHADAPPRAGLFEQTGLPAPRYVEVAFGRAHFGVAEGLAWVAERGEQIPLAQLGTITFQSWSRIDDQAMVAALLSFHGHRLWLAVEGAPEIEHDVRPIRGIVDPGVDVRIEFEWSDARERQFSSQRPNRR